MSTSNKNSTPPQISPLLTFTDGYSCYLLIINNWIQYSWLFPFPNKEPPIDTVCRFLQKHRNQEGLCCIHTDLSGKLAGSTGFHHLISNNSYVLETTASESLFQNGAAECMHHTLYNYMLAMLHVACLDSTYWTYAMKYAVYLSN